MISDDIPFLIRDIKNEMSFHTDNAGKIPYSFKAMPKSFMGESHKVDNKFLNNHLGEIEEAVDKKLMEKNSFIYQQVNYHKESGILKLWDKGTYSEKLVYEIKWESIKGEEHGRLDQFT